MSSTSNLFTKEKQKWIALRDHEKNRYMTLLNLVRNENKGLQEKKDSKKWALTVLSEILSAQENIAMYNNKLGEKFPLNIQSIKDIKQYVNAIISAVPESNQAEVAIHAIYFVKSLVDLNKPFNKQEDSKKFATGVARSLDIFKKRVARFLTPDWQDFFAVWGAYIKKSLVALAVATFVGGLIGTAVLSIGSAGLGAAVAGTEFLKLWGFMSGSIALTIGATEAEKMKYPEDAHQITVDAVERKLNDTPAIKQSEENSPPIVESKDVLMQRKATAQKSVDALLAEITTLSKNTTNKNSNELFSKIEQFLIAQETVFECSENLAEDALLLKQISLRNLRDYVKGIDLFVHHTQKITPEMQHAMAFEASKLVLEVMNLNKPVVIGEPAIVQFNEKITAAIDTFMQQGEKILQPAIDVNPAVKDGWSACCKWGKFLGTSLLLIAAGTALGALPFVTGLHIVTGGLMPASMVSIVGPILKSLAIQVAVLGTSATSTTSYLDYQSKKGDKTPRKENNWLKEEGEKFKSKFPSGKK